MLQARGVKDKRKRNFRLFVEREKQQNSRKGRIRNCVSSKFKKKMEKYALNTGGNAKSKNGEN